MGHLQLKHKDKTSNFYLNDGESITFGQNPEGEYRIILKGVNIEDYHGKIENSNNRIYIYDYSKTSSIKVDNKKIPKNKPFQIPEGSIAELADADTIIRLLKVQSTENEDNSAPRSVDITKYLNENKIVRLGHHADNDITINDSLAESFHAEIIYLNNKYYIKDLGSQHGTYFNGEKIRGKQIFNPGDVFFIGLNSFSYGSTELKVNPESAITAINISKFFKSGGIGLQPLNMNINRGELVALMGPSGCGKSTLLKALSGDSPATGGSVHLFGLELKQNYKLLKKKIGYVPQDDIIHKELTVYKTLYLAGKLRLGSTISEIELQKRIAEVLETLKLNNDEISFKKIKDLSGGQRKRVSIAVELLNKPSILFLDEPTSPLDPETIDEFLKCIQQLCQNGTTVVMVTHKPEDLSYADKLIFMGTAGHHVFEGKSKDILTHFDKENLVQIYSLLSKSSETKKWYKKWYANAVEPEITSRNNFKVDRDSHFFYQLKWLIKRCYAVKVGNKSNLILQFIQPVIIALLINLVFKNLIQDGRIKPGAIFMMNIATIWFGVSTAGKEIIGELAIYKRERMFNLKIGPYLISKVVVLGLIGVIQTLLITSIIKINFKEQIPLFLDVWIFLTFIHLSSTLLGLFISAAAKSTESVMTIIPIALLPQNILAGIVAPIEDKVTEIASIFTFGRWGTEALARIQDKYKTAEFTEQLINKNLYYKDSFSWFNSFTGNLTIMCIIDFTLILLLIWTLKRKDAIQF
jgi:ABC-type multidrug transport system ATPase subunit